MSGHAQTSSTTATSTRQVRFYSSGFRLKTGDELDVSVTGPSEMRSPPSDYNGIPVYPGAFDRNGNPTNEYALVTPPIFQIPALVNPHAPIGAPPQAVAVRVGGEMWSDVSYYPLREQPGGPSLSQVANEDISRDNRKRDNDRINDTKWDPDMALERPRFRIIGQPPRRKVGGGLGSETDELEYLKRKECRRTRKYKNRIASTVE